MRKFRYAPVAFAAACIAQAPAQAEEVTLRVPYSAADLATEDGLNSLKARIAAAAEAACSPVDEWAFTATSDAECTATLMRKARGEIERLRAGAGAE